MASFIKPRNQKNALYQRAIGKVYRDLFENPRRNAIKTRFLSLPPSKPPNPDLKFSIHMMVCKRDLSMAICSVFALNLFSETSFFWVFHDDGSLDNKDHELLSEKVPGSRIIRKNIADELAQELLKEYPEILKYRDNHVLAPKIIDVQLMGKGEKIGYVDSDVLFVNQPDFFLKVLKDNNSKNYFNKDIKSSYVKTPVEIERLIGVRPLEKVNSGLWIMYKDDIDLEKIEYWLKHPGFADILYNYTMDQTFLCLLASISRNGFDYFPPGYDVDLYKELENSIDKHYVGVIRHGYELEGLTYLLKEKNFERRWREFVKN